MQNSSSISQNESARRKLAKDQEILAQNQFELKRKQNLALIKQAAMIDASDSQTEEVEDNLNQNEASNNNSK